MGARQKETINTRVIKYIRVASTRTKLFYIFFLAKNKLKPLKNRALTGWWVVDTLARIKKSPIVGTNAKALLSVVVFRRSWMMGWGWRMKTYITIKLIPTTDSVG